MPLFGGKAELNVIPQNLTAYSLVFDIMIGLILGVGFIIGNILLPSFVTIGVPSEYFTTATGSYLGSVVIAPFAEELAFRGVLEGLLSIVFASPLAGLISAIAFSLFHLTAYGLGLQAAFIGAFGFGLIAYIVSKWRHSIIPVIVLHMLFNLWVVGTHLFFAA